jgi:hypothetical protein
MVVSRRRTSLWSDVFAPALIYNAFDPIEISDAERCDISTKIDNLGETR